MITPKVVMLQVAISKSFFTIQAGFNIMTLSENGQTTTINLPVGYYTRKAMKAQIATSLTSDSSVLGHNWTYSVTYQKLAEPC
jgi:homoserine trans-succinylase